MTLSEILQGITAEIAAAIDIDGCRNWGIQRADGMVYDGTRNNGEYIGIDATQAPSGYLRLAGEISTSAQGGSCKRLLECEVPLVAVRWAFGQSYPMEVVDGMVAAIAKYKPAGRYKPIIEIDGVSAIYNDIFQEETSNEAKFPAGLQLGKVSMTMRVRIAACDLDAPSCAAVAPTVVYDPDAKTLFDAVVANGGSITTMQAAVTNQLFLNLKADSLYARIFALHLYIGGAAAPHRLNAVNPIDDNAAFRLAFAGGWTHTALGATPNGINAYANTFFIPATHAAANSLTIGYYSGSTAAGPYIEMGCNGNGGGANNGQTYIAPSLSGTQFRAVNSTGNNTGAGLLPSNLHVSARTSSTLVSTYRAGALVATDSQPNSTSTQPIYIGARNNNSVANAFSARSVVADFIADGLNVSEVATLSAHIETWAVGMGRNVL